VLCYSHTPAAVPFSPAICLLLWATADVASSCPTSSSPLPLVRLQTERCLSHLVTALALSPGPQLSLALRVAAAAASSARTPRGQQEAIKPEAATPKKAKKKHWPKETPPPQQQPQESQQQRQQQGGKVSSAALADRGIVVCSDEAIHCIEVVAQPLPFVLLLPSPLLLHPFGPR